jgi:hypothetical protein
MPSDPKLQQWQKEEENARRAAVIFLTIGGMVFLDISSIEDEKRREEATRAWVAFGIALLLLGFFVIAPEREALEAASKKR